MSTDYSTYVGPYVRCEVGAVEVEVTRRSCTNAKCKSHADDVWDREIRFCRRCGWPIGDVTSLVTRQSVDAFAVQELISDELITAFGDAYFEWSATNGVHIWKAEGSLCVLDNYADFELVEVTPDVIREELEAFALRFHNTLTRFRSVYGEEAVTLHWGIIQDCL